MSTKNRGGRPPKSPEDKKGEFLAFRFKTSEKAAFLEAAEIAGISLSGWIRERLRKAAIKELADVGRRIPFLLN